MVDNNLDKYTIIVEEQDNYTIELNGQGPQGARGPIGPQGVQGERGEKGEQGDIGPANILTVGSVVKGEEAEVTIEGESPNQTINFVLPKGDKGDKGDQGIQGIQGIQGVQGEVGPVGPQGKAATITIGEVRTGEPNTQASVTNIGTSTDSILNFSIPRGYKGEAATIVVGSTTTSEPGTEANVVNSGDENMAILEFTIPKGEKGDKGNTGEQGPQGIQGLTGPQGPQGIQGDVGPKGDKGDQGIEGPRGPQGLKGISVTGVEQISKVGLVATYRMYFSDGTHFDYEVTDGSVEGVTREQVISLIGYEPASYTSVEGLTTRVSTLEERVEDLTTELDSKQDKGNYALKSEIPTNNNQLINGAGYITSSYHDGTKQDVIPDLATIRSGAAKGATALQSYTETDPIYTADKPKLALKSEIPTKTSQLTNDSGFINNDSTFVHKTGNETIAGTKTFSSTISGSINGKSTKLDTPRVGTDYNSLPIKNTTYIEEHNSSSPNQPEANWFFAQTMQGEDLGYAGQLAMGMTSENVYYRNKNANNWLPWKKLAFTTDNVTSATKATQDSSGQQINTTYVKGVTASNATITVTKGNGTTSTATINNVANATNATNATKAIQDGDGNVITSTYLKKTEGTYHPPLLSTVWSDHLLNDMSWLRADTFSWQDGTTYSLVYNELLSEYNNSASTTKTDGSITYKLTPKGYKIALASQETAILNKYNSDGIAWYYILDNGDNTTEGGGSAWGDSAAGGEPRIGDTSGANKRFKLPRTKFGFEGLRTSVGDDIEAGLPNITATWRNCGFADTNGAYEGTLYHSTTWAPQNGGFKYIVSTFDASRSSSIYGNSDTVQPPATQMYLYFYVGNFTESAEAQTAGLNSELLNGKLDLNASNLNTDGKSLISSLGMPSNKYIDLTLGASGSTYTAPANGWVNIIKQSSNVGRYVALYNLSKSDIGVTSAAVTANARCVCLLPVGKNDEVICNYDANGATVRFRFYYAEGSK